MSALANRYGCRPVCMVGSLVASAGFFLSTFSPNVDILILLYGGVGGKSQHRVHDCSLTLYIMLC